MIWLSSDTHFSHARIIEYSGRPYKDVHEMNKALIDNWNRCVQPNDTIYHLGDFAFCQYTQFIKILDRLNGEIHVILGNHDKVIEKNRDALLKHGKIKSIQHYAEIKYDNHVICMFHYGMRTWHWNYRGSILCFGHSHNKLPPYGRSLDVGVDSTVITTEYRPVSVKEVVRWAEQQEIKTSDFGNE